MKHLSLSSVSSILFPRDRPRARALFYFLIHFLSWQSSKSVFQCKNFQTDVKSLFMLLLPMLYSLLCERKGPLFCFKLEKQRALDNLRICFELQNMQATNLNMHFTLVFYTLIKLKVVSWMVTHAFHSSFLVFWMHFHHPTSQGFQILFLWIFKFKVKFLFKLYYPIIKCTVVGKNDFCSSVQTIPINKVPKTFIYTVL